MRILVTNDDGIHARGIQNLIKELSSIAEIYLVAPDRERSGTGHSITVFDPIRVVKTNLPGVKQGWIVGGTPGNCVENSNCTFDLTPDRSVVSGISWTQSGEMYYNSGTVSAAAEGVIMALSALAVSLDSFKDEQDFNFTARFTRRMVIFWFKRV